MVANIYESYRPLMEEWKDYIGVVKENVEGYTDVEATQLAMLLENTKSEIEVSRGRMASTSPVMEATDVSMVDTFQSNVFDIITSVFPNLLANDIVSVQPLDRRNGQIFYLKFTYGQNKGSIKAGDDMISPQQGVAGRDYSGELITGELMGAPTGGAVSQNLTYLPIIPGTIKISDGISKFCVDVPQGDGTGKFESTDGLGTGTVNYATGAVSLSGVTATGTLTFDYRYDLNSFDARVNEVDVRVVSEPVVARPRKLKSVYMFDVGYDLKMSFGLDMDQVILKATSGEIGYEIDNEIMQDLLIAAGTHSAWGKNVPFKGQDQKDYDRTLVDAINDASNTILGKTRRYEASFIICGKNAATRIEGLNVAGYEIFKRVSTGGIVGGPHLAGILDGKYRVYKNPYYPDDAVLVGAKGEMFIESGYVYAPYLPLFASQLLVDSDFKAQRGFCTLYAKKVINPFMYHRIDLVDNETLPPDANTAADPVAP